MLLRPLQKLLHCITYRIVGVHWQTSPADGRVIFYGKVIDGALEQIKGITYSLHGFIGPRTGSLLTFSSQDTELLDLALLTNSYLDHGAASLLMNPGNCLYQCLVYLSPGEYHHFHSPADWVVTGRRHFPGMLWSNYSNSES